jgi:hypothetical protein
MDTRPKKCTQLWTHAPKSAHSGHAPLLKQTSKPLSLLKTAPCKTTLGTLGLETFER